MDSEQDKPVIEIDPKSGFCFGVIKAIEQAEKALAERGTLYCLGDIVHNEAEMARLSEKGLITITHEKFQTLKDCTVLLRAHGEPPSTYDIARKNNITIIDATCPVVLGLQKLIKKTYNDNKNNNGQILLFGKSGHAEIVGLLGQTDNTATVINNIKSLDNIDFTRPTTLFSQTTQDIHKLEEIKTEITKRTKNDFVFHDTICRRVANRETDLKQFAQKYDIIIFVSGEKSSNGKILFDICKKVNSNTFFVSKITDLNNIPFTRNKTIGICGATSTPKWLMQDIASKILKINLL